MSRAERQMQNGPVGMTTLRVRTTQLACALAVVGLSLAASDRPPLNKMRDMQAQGDRRTTDLEFAFDRDAAYTVFKLSNPDRLVLDFSGADVSGNEPEVSGGLVESVALNQISDGENSIGRCIVRFTDGADYRVERKGNRVIVRFVNALAPNAESPAIVTASAVEAVPAVEAPVAAANTPKAHDAPAQAPAAVAAPAAPADPNAVIIHDEAGYAEAVAALETSSTEQAKVTAVNLTGSKSFVFSLVTEQVAGETAVKPQIMLMGLTNPDRLVIDVRGARRGFEKNAVAKLKGGFVKAVRYGPHENHLRFVLDLEPGTQVVARKAAVRNGVGVELSRAPVAIPAPAVSAVVPAPTPAPVADVAPAPMVAAAAPVADNKPGSNDRDSSNEEGPTSPTVSMSGIAKDYKVATVNFDEKDGVSRIRVKFTGDMPQYRVLRRGERAKVLELFNTHVPPHVVQSLDTTAFAGPVALVSTYPDPKEATRARVLVNLRADVEQRIVRSQGEIVWEFRSVQAAAPAPGAAVASASTNSGMGDDELAVNVHSGDLNGLKVVAPKAAQESTGESSEGEDDENGDKVYKGKRISLDFKDADIRNILRLIADVSKLNIIASDDVKGSITVTLRNVPWDEALDIILQSKGLGKQQRGNIVRVAPLEVLQREAEISLAKQKAQQEAEPLKVRLIPVNYALAGDISAQVKDVLSDRGSVTVDTRTNVLVVKDVVESLVKAETLVRNLDTQTPQVLIESRIIEANSNFRSAFGIQWGGNFSASAATGNDTGLAFPNSIGVFGGADDARTNSQLSGTANPGNFAINLPVAVGAGSGGALGFTFGSANGAANLNLRLSALESTGSIRVVSSPKVTTLDNKTAKINQGVSIPISVVSAAGVQTTFVNAALELEVTPHVTADGSVLMKLKVTNNQPDFGRTGAAGDPTILRQEAESEMLVRDGDTAVIGGIYVRRTTSGTDGVPLLSRIPVLGYLFKREQENDERAELLIFVTPRIVNRSQTFTQVE
jgi:type IV pilus assembly protein PilQ